MNSLLISDLHLTADPRDAYRWRLFEWLREEMPKHAVKELFILGDLTERKDYHSAKLVNRIVDELLRTYRQANLFGITVLRGNHDGLDPDCAFFKFLGQYPSITYISAPYQKPIDGQEVLMLPHTTNPVRAWEPVEMHLADVILMHATVRGALGENDYALEGIPSGLLATARRAKIWSGDVHVPQKIGRVEYVGAPYPIRFGDKFEGRAVLAKGWKTFESLPIPSIKRRTLPVASDAPPDLDGLAMGDQVKLRISLAPAEYADWNAIKADSLALCQASGIEVCGVDLVRMQAQPSVRVPIRKPTGLAKRPAVILREFCGANTVEDSLASAGAALLEEAEQA